MRRLLDQHIRFSVVLDQMTEGQGGGQDSSWSLGRGCNHLSTLSKVVALPIFAIPGQAQLRVKTNSRPVSLPAEEEKERHAVPEQRAWLQRVPETLTACLMLLSSVGMNYWDTWLVAGNVLGL